MYNKVIQKGKIEITVSDNKHFDWAYLHHIATVKKGLIKPLSDFKDDYFVSVKYDTNEPHYIATLVNGGLYPEGVYRLSKMYNNASDKYSSHVHLNVIYSLFSIVVDLKDDINGKLWIGTRSPHDSSWSAIMDVISCRMGALITVDEENVYMVGSDPNKQSTWKHVYYVGDKSLLTMPKMTIEEYNERFGISTTN